MANRKWDTSNMILEIHSLFHHFLYPNHYKPRTNTQLIAPLEIAMFKVQLVFLRKRNRLMATS